MRTRRTISVVAVFAVIVVLVFIRIWTLNREPLVSVLYQSYGDYYGGPWAPRQAEFQVVCRRRAPVKVWGPCRVEFKIGTGLPQPGTGTGTMLPVAGTATDVQVTLTGNERGAWRVLVPVSDYRVVNLVERCMGRGAIVRFLDSWLRRSPRWVTSKWVDELPQRSPNPRPTTKGSDADISQRDASKTNAISENHP